MAEVVVANGNRTGSGIRFAATPSLVGTRRILRLPDDASAKLPSRGQVAVTGTIDGHAIQTVLEPDGMRGHWLELDKKMQSLDAGKLVAVALEPTKAWPEPEVPHDLRAALDNAPELAEHWSDITPMARWEWVRWIRATRNLETRTRRVEVAISKLRKGMRRPCCFDLASCTDPELSKNGKLIDAV